MGGEGKPVWLGFETLAFMMNQRGSFAANQCGYLCEFLFPYNALGGYRWGGSLR